MDPVRLCLCVMHTVCVVISCKVLNAYVGTIWYACSFAFKAWGMPFVAHPVLVYAARASPAAV